MRKREFLNQLRKRLKEENCNDVDDIILYYDELIEDAIERTGQYEETVVKELGSIEDIVIRVNPSSNRSVRNEKIYYDEYETEENLRKRTSTQPKNTVNNKKDGIGIKILLAIVSAPLWFGAIISLAALIFISAMVGVVVGIIGIICIAQGVIDISLSLGNALFQMGIGCILCGLASIAAPLVIKIISLLLKAIISFIKWLLGAFNSRERRLGYEN